MLAVPCLTACAGEPAPTCVDEAYQWVWVGSDAPDVSATIDAISVTTIDGSEVFTVEVYEWAAGDDAHAGGPRVAFGAPDGVCAALPGDATSFVANPGPIDDAWDYVTVYTCDGDGGYAVQLLVGDGDHQRHPAAGRARGTSRFAASSCGEHAPGAVLSR